jgi:hypothetical protein
MLTKLSSGSYVMGFVLADYHGWLDKSGQPPFEVVPLNTFAKLRDGVNSGTADFFMWEHFTSKKYYDNGEIRRIGEIYTPWSSWKIVSSEEKMTDKSLEKMAESINCGMRHFNEHQDEAVEYISTNLDYSAHDATAWLETVKFAENVRGVDPSVIDKTIDILGKAGVVDPSSCRSEDMIAIKRAERATVS